MLYFAIFCLFMRSFPKKTLTQENYAKEFGNILNALSDVINLQTKLTFESELMYGMDR